MEKQWPQPDNNNLSINYLKLFQNFGYGFSIQQFFIYTLTEVYDYKSYLKYIRTTFVICFFIFIFSSYIGSFGKYLA